MLTEFIELLQTKVTVEKDEYLEKEYLEGSYLVRFGKLDFDLERCITNCFYFVLSNFSENHKQMLAI